MLTGFQHLHSALRWVVLFLLVWTLIQSLLGKRKGESFSSRQAKLGLFTMISLHIQLLLGLTLYVGKGWASMLGNPSTMGNAIMRFFVVEHLIGMIIAVAFGTLGHSLVKRASDDSVKYKRQILFFGLALVIIMASIPWPFRPGFEAYGWF
mgnify:CR=1 FL=1